ncbi:MAG: PQQ-binding-like beta-propeller repeat protein [Psychroflexus sp.]
MKNFQFLLLLCFAHVLNSQIQEAPDFTIEPGFAPNFIEFSQDDQYLVLEDENRYQVWNMANSEKIIEGKHRFKIGRLLSGSNISEGSGYFLFGNENIFLAIDYTLNFTNVVAFDLKKGEEIWSTENLDMGLSTFEIMHQVLSSGRTVQEVPQLNSSVHIDYNYFTKDLVLDKLVSYMPQRSSISVNGKEGLQFLDLKTGEILWTQPELKGGVGEIFYDETHDILVAIRVNNSEFENLSSKPEVQALNAENGDLIWTTKYDGDFIPGTAFVYEDILILPYYGLSLIDIENGEELDGDVKASMKRARRMARNMSILGSQGLGDNGSYPILDESGIMHYFVGFQNGKHLNPDGGKKAYLQIDVLKDKFILVEEDIAKTNNRVVQELLTDERFYVKLTKGLSSTYIISLDRKTGKVIFETDKIKNRFGSDTDPFLLDGNRIVDISAKGIYFYDSMSGEENAFIKFKAFDVGRLRNHIIYKNGLILLGTKGVSFTDDYGNVKHTIEDFGKVRDYRIGGEIWLVEDKRFVRLNAETLEVLDDLSFKRKENVFFSPSGKHFLKLNEEGTKLNVYNM